MYLPLIVASCALAQFDSRHCHMSSPRRQPLQPLITNQREPSTIAITTKPSKSAKKKPRSDENELFENRAGALLHRVLREKQMLLSRIRAQAFALEQATVQARHLESRALSPRHTLPTESSIVRCSRLNRAAFHPSNLRQRARPRDGCRGPALCEAAEPVRTPRSSM